LILQVLTVSFCQGYLFPNVYTLFCNVLTNDDR
jgi:hypothetical protein